MNYNASDIVLLGVKFENASLKLERDLFTTQYEVSSENIILEKKNSQHLLEPAMVLCGLSLELYLKAIYFYENNKFIREHDLNILYENLSDESRHSIKFFFDNNKINYVNRNKRFFTDFNVEILQFIDSLKELSNIFIKFRYFYEEIDLEKNISMREVVRQSIINRINELNLVNYKLD